MGLIKATGVLGVKNDRVCTFIQQKGPVFGQAIAFLVPVFEVTKLLTSDKRKQTTKTGPLAEIGAERRAVYPWHLHGPAPKGVLRERQLSAKAATRKKHGLGSEVNNFPTSAS